jgi:hypothetical protein
MIHAPVDVEKWSGEGAFTQTLIETLRNFEEIEFLRVEDAPSTRSDADYNFISNEIFVGFHTRVRREPSRRWGILPTVRTVVETVMSLAELEAVLLRIDSIGPPDYADEGMLQYLRTERIVPPYQTRGYKLIELVRIYEARPHPLRTGRTGES